MPSEYQCRPRIYAHAFTLEYGSSSAYTLLLLKIQAVSQELVAHSKARTALAREF
ncbi:predicted protein [Plenodomus lingam JN3]|uniref:Predicted protein n=1 Tax=Leptosphaeria maculans (strain JN3 / isolate v23.1.3 / race Av1-4-5-6-7-8) TaxID=985895 RepID=E5AC92_LEPMJ|nr:predicted protein [Plenodomus lingam JN3]CBY02094.1 predicted protein [Plenodomus lingam JN3]